MEVGTYDIHGSLHDDQGAMGRASKLASCAPEMASLNCVQKRGCASWEIEHKSGAYLSCQHVSQIIECVGNSPLIMSVHPSIHPYLCPSIHPYLRPSSIHASIPALRRDESGPVGCNQVVRINDLFFLIENWFHIDGEFFLLEKTQFTHVFSKKFSPKFLHEKQKFLHEIIIIIIILINK
jgi:hypothetical protein